MNGVVALKKARDYTDETANSLGSLKGAPCTVKSVNNSNGITTITLEWEGTDGAKETTQFTVNDGQSAYEVAKANGFVGTEQEWLDSLKVKGDDGYSPTITEDSNNTSTVYKLNITHADNTVTTTPNLKGARGNDGQTPNFTIGTVTTLPSGSNATASIVGTSANPILNLGIPKGVDGTNSSVTTDEKVKLTSKDTNSKYLEDLIDNSTIQIDSTNNVLYVSKIDGQNVSVAEINFLSGVTSNIQQQINNLGKSMSMYGVFQTKADLLSCETIPIDGNTAIVVEDETLSNKQMTYIYIEANSEWTAVAESSISIRDFTVNPINLDTETIGVLPDAKIDSVIARLSQVLTSELYKGSADGIVKSADTLNGLLHTIDDLNNAISDSHKHLNMNELNNIVSNGLGNRYLSDNGNYTELIVQSSSAPLNQNVFWIDNSDSSALVLKIYNGTDWVQVSNSSNGSNSPNSPNSPTNTTSFSKMEEIDITDIINYDWNDIQYTGGDDRVMTKTNLALYTELNNGIIRNLLNSQLGKISDEDCQNIVNYLNEILL